MVHQLCDWADEVGAMTLLLVCLDYANADDCPAFQGRPVPLAKSLSCDFNFGAGKVCQVTKPHLQEEFHLLDCSEHTLCCGWWRTKGLEDKGCNDMCYSIIAIVCIHQGNASRASCLLDNIVSQHLGEGPVVCHSILLAINLFWQQVILAGI